MIGGRIVGGRVRRCVWVVAVVVALAAVGLPGAGAAGAAETSRVAGASRFDTAVAISQRGFPNGAERVFVARADVFADVLAAGSLTGGPVLLVPSCGQVPSAVTDEIFRLDPQTVTALGGEAAVCQPVLDVTAGERGQDRLTGRSRFGTAVAISQAQFPDGASQVFVAEAQDSADAVAGGTLTGGPVLSVPSSGSVPDEVVDEVARLGVDRVIALGGVAAVSDDVVAQVAGGLPTVRLAGADRFATTAAISAFEFPTSEPDGPSGRRPSVAYLARADVFADAVAAGSLTDGPILLVPSCGDLPASVAAELSRLQVPKVVALGGGNAICDQLLASQSTSRVSVTPEGASPVGPDADFSAAAVSADGRHVAFASDAVDLVPGDGNGVTDVFVRDRQSGVTERVSVDFGGADPDDVSYAPSISADGRYIAFTSEASDLVADDRNGRRDVFVRDRQTGTTARISVDTGGGEPNSDSGGPSISADGRFVAFDSFASDLVVGDTNGTADVFVRDQQAATTTRVGGPDGGEPDGSAGGPSISSNGRFVTFSSSASNLVAGDRNRTGDVFVWDAQTGTSERISADTDGGDADSISVAGSISADGRFVAFQSNASDLVVGDGNRSDDVFVRDRQTGATERVSVDLDGGDPDDFSFRPSISADGRLIAFYSSASDLVAGDSNGDDDVFVRDRQTGTTERVTVDVSGRDPNGSSRSPSISADGGYVAFVSEASDLVAGDTKHRSEMFIRDRQSATTERVGIDTEGGDPTGAASSSRPSISADGRLVAFESDATDLVAGDNNDQQDVFVRDLDTGTTTRVSVDLGGGDPDGFSSDPSISADGHFVAFTSFAADLVAGDSNNQDVFVRDLRTGATELITAGPGGGDADSGSTGLSISADGRFVAFSATLSDAAGGNGNAEVFVRDRLTGTTERVSVGIGGGAPDRGSSEPSISADGRFVAFSSSASDLVADDDRDDRRDVFVRDRRTGSTERISADTAGGDGNGSSVEPAISADGRFVVFESSGTDLVVGASDASNDVFVRDRQTGTTQRVGANPEGGEALRLRRVTSISADGRLIAFSSFASDLVTGDANGEADVFVWDRRTGATRRVSVATGGGDPDGSSFDTSISADGRFVAFDSSASNLVVGDNLRNDVFVRDLGGG